MNEKTKKILSIFTITAFIGASITIPLVLRKKRKQKEVEWLLLQLRNGSGVQQFGDNRDLEKALNSNYSNFVDQRLSYDEARRLADDIKKSFGYLGAFTDEDKIFYVFNSVKNRTQLAQIAKAYNDKFKSPLINDLRAELSASELDKINSITSVLR